MVAVVVVLVRVLVVTVLVVTVLVVPVVVVAGEQRAAPVTVLAGVGHPVGMIHRGVDRAGVVSPLVLALVAQDSPWSLAGSWVDPCAGAATSSPGGRPVARSVSRAFCNMTTAAA